MLETVFLPSRSGKRARLYRGRYRCDDMPEPVEVPLYTPDELVARQRLRAIIIRRQRIAEGLAAPEPMRAAQHAPIADLVGEYAVDLIAQSAAPAHVKDTSRRILRIAREARWNRLADVTAAGFTAWRGRVAGDLSAKTLREYHVSLSAFFNWLIETERFDRNPVARVKKTNTRGRETLTRRAFTPDEARRLLAVSGYHRIPYLVLLYTGLRYQEAKGLRWCDLVKEGGQAWFEIAASETKGRKRARIPLRPELLAEIESLRDKRAEWNPARRIFKGLFPAQKSTPTKPNALRRDMAAAGIPVADARGHVIDYHSFRKTWNTWAATAGVPQRAAQAILRHSTPDLTAGPYTDLEGLGLAAEVRRLEWVGDSLEIAPETDSPASESTNGNRVKTLAEAISTQILAMVDLTGLESGKSFRDSLLREILAATRRKLNARSAPPHRESEGAGHALR
jgi:integrase